MAMAQLSESDQSKMQMMQDLEIEMMSDLYNRMTSSCHKKCIAPKYHEAELGENCSILTDFRTKLIILVF